MTCLQCGKELTRKHQQKFCCQSHAAMYSNPKRRADRPKCMACGKPVKKVTARYCSVVCKLEHEYSLYIKSWLAGEQSGLRGAYSTSKHIYRYLIEKHGHKCSICGLSYWQGQPIPLVLDHINGNGLDNSEGNIRMICPNCDRQTDTFGGRNRGKGRKERLKYDIWKTKPV